MHKKKALVINKGFLRILAEAVPVKLKQQPFDLK